MAGYNHEEEVGVRDLTQKLNNNLRKTTEGKQSQDTYLANLQQLVDSNTKSLNYSSWNGGRKESILDANTRQMNTVLNTLAFDMDKYGKDPWSRKGLEDLEFNVRVPIGTERGYIPDYTYGQNLKHDNGVLISGKAVDSSKNGNTLGSVLRHEGSHRPISALGEETYVRALDEIYAGVNKNTAAENTASEYVNKVNPHNKSYSNPYFRFAKLMEMTKNMSDKADPNPLTVDMFDWDVNNMPPEQKLGLLDRSHQFTTKPDYKRIR